jgi:hypothetical protein
MNTTDDPIEEPEPFELMRALQSSFLMVFVLLAMGFYYNDHLSAIMAWCFGAVGFIEYCLIGLLRLERDRGLSLQYNEI